MNTIEYFTANIPSLSEKELLEFIDKGTSLKLSKDDIFLDFGCKSNKIAFVETGILEMVMDIKDTEKIIDFMYPGTCATDYLSYLTDQPSELQIRASVDSKILIFTKEKLTELSIIDDKYQEIIRLITEKSNIELMQRIRWMYLSPKERYEIFRKKYADIIQQIPQYKIASFLNVTPEWLSKIRGHK